MTSIPRPLTPSAGWSALAAMRRERNPLAALEAIRGVLGDVFQIPLSRFDPVVLSGPDAARFVLASHAGDFRWRVAGDPVVQLLREGVLVTDGEAHDALRRTMNPALHKSRLGGYVAAMVARTDQVAAAWKDGEPIDMLVEMRRAALLILMDTLYKVDFTPELAPLWTPILRTLKFISPGPWIVWPGIPRPGFASPLREMDGYLYRLIHARRANPGETDDLLGLLIASGLEDGPIRDQLLTMLIAGHDTSTALLAWSLYLLGRHPEMLARARSEVDAALVGRPPDFDGLGRLEYLDRVIQETLRLYPPIHTGMRLTASEIEFQGYRLPAGQRVMFSIYLTQRHPADWPDPGRFDPERFTPENVRARPHYTYIPFGGGARSCIGLAFAQVEVKAVLARLLQTFDLSLLPGRVYAHMGATLEPRPAVWMRVRRRNE